MKNKLSFFLISVLLLSGCSSLPSGSEEQSSFDTKNSDSLDNDSNSSSDENLSDVEKIEKFQEVLSTLSYNTSSIQEIGTDMYAYPSQTENTFTYYIKRDYHRYTDILTYDYYYTDKSYDNETKYAEYQYYYDNDYFYSVYHNIDDSTKNTFNKSAFNKNIVESFLSIDYLTMFSSIEKYLKIYASDPTTYTSDKVSYSFTFDYKALKEANKNYSYSEQFEYYKYSDQIGEWVTYSHAANYGLLIENGRITSLNYEYGYYTALSDGIQEAVYRKSIFEFNYSDDGYDTFSGEKFTS